VVRVIPNLLSPTIDTGNRTGEGDRESENTLKLVKLQAREKSLNGDIVGQRAG
jgi:hypothetical protein